MRDVWFAAGADEQQLIRGAQITVPGENRPVDLWFWDGEGLEEDGHKAEWIYQQLAETGLAATLSADDFVDSARRLIAIWYVRRDLLAAIPDLDAYVRPIVDCGLSAEWIGRLPCKCADDDDTLRVLVPADQWAAILCACVNRATDPRERDQLIAASLQMAFEDAGHALPDVTDPRVALAMRRIRDDAPAFIQDAPLAFHEKFELQQLTAADCQVAQTLVPDAGISDELLLEAKREACENLVQRSQLLRELTANAPTDGLSHEERGRIAVPLLTLTAQQAVTRVLEDRLQEQQTTNRDALFADREQLTEAVIATLKTRYVIRKGFIGDRQIADVLRERLARLAWPEFRLFAGILLQERAAEQLWIQATCEEMGLKYRDPRTDETEDG